MIKKIIPLSIQTASSSHFFLRQHRITIFPEEEEYTNHRLENIMSDPNLAETAHSAVILAILTSFLIWVAIWVVKYY